MIPYIKWPDRWFDEPYSPFLRGKVERPIKITFHTSSFTGTPPEQAEAIELLRELANLLEVEAIDTEPGELPHLEIGEYDGKTNSIPISVTSKDQRRDSAIEYYDGLLHEAVRISNQCLVESPATQAALQDVFLIRAHERLRQDILITLSQRLLEHRSSSEGTNIRTPLEAAKIVGLYLRSRDNYTWRLTPKLAMRLNRGFFYWVLSRHKLPNMWRYFSACVHAGSVRGDDILYLGQSILMRCAWAHEARDAIGKCFYIPQNNNTRDTMMYHFNYLTLLLAGALDAQARVAWRAYGITKPKERRSSFRNDEFLKELQHRTTSLHSLVSSQHFEDLMTLLHELRNTIHGAGFPTTGSGQGSLVMVLPEYKNDLWQAAQRLGPPERWGMIQKHDELKFEPYTYAITLVEECLRQIDEVAAATDITSLFPAGYSIPELIDEPPDDYIFNEFTRRRVAILG